MTRRARRDYRSHNGLPITKRACTQLAGMMGSVVELLLDEGEPRRLPLMYSFTDYWARWGFYLAQLDGDPA